MSEPDHRSGDIVRGSPRKLEVPASEGPAQASQQKNCPSAADATATSSGAYDHHSTTTSLSTTSLSSVKASLTGPERRSVTAEQLVSVLSQERMDTYVKAAGGDLKRAVRLYTWNVAISSAFWGSFSVLEVALRNAIHTQLTRLAGRDDWWEGQTGLRDSERDRVKDASETAKRLHPTSCNPGHVIAELTLGFWVGLLANRHHQRLWEHKLQHAFPHLVDQRRELHRKLESLRKLRNRIAHHEPIFARNLAADHAQLLKVIEAISPDAVTWVRQNSRVEHVLDLREGTIAGTEPLTF